MDSPKISEHKQILQEFLTEFNKLSLSSLNTEDLKILILKNINNALLKYTQYETNNQNNTYDSLFGSIENLIMGSIHDRIFKIICEKHAAEDEILYNKFCELSALKITPDQLGAQEEYSIPLPAAVVELASLDMHQTPADKRICLSTAFDLTLAELKGAIVDIIALNFDNKIPIINVSDITPVLATIIIYAKPMHLISNLYYIENFHWGNKTAIESECLLAFMTAIDKLKVVTIDSLLPRSKHIYYGVGIEDVFKLTSEFDNKYDRNGQRIFYPSNPLERHIEHFTNLITKSTFNNVTK